MRSRPRCWFFALVMTPTAAGGKRAEAAGAVWGSGPFSANPFGVPGSGLSHPLTWVG